MTKKAVLLAILFFLLPTCIQPAFAAGVELTVGVLSSSYTENQQALNTIILRDAQLKGVQAKVTVIDLYNLVLQMGAGRGPDLIWLSVNDARRLADWGLTTPLDDFLKKEPAWQKTLQKLYPGVLGAARWLGRTVGVPISTTINGVVYNPERAARAGVEVSNNWNWQEFTIAASKMTAFQLPVYGSYINGVEVFNTSGFAFSSFGLSSWLPFLWSNDGDYISADLTTPLLHQQNSKDALTWLRSLVAGGVAEIWPYSPAIQVTSGILGMTIGDHTALSLVMPKTFSRCPQHDCAERPASVSMAPIPRSPATGKSVGLIDARLLVVNKATLHPTEAFRFALAGLAPTVQAVMLQQGRLPVRPDIAYPSLATLPAKQVVDIVAATGRAQESGAINGSSILQGVTERVMSYLTGDLTLKELVSAQELYLTSILSEWNGKRQDLWSKLEPPSSSSGNYTSINFGNAATTTPTAQRPPTTADKRKTQITLLTMDKWMYKIADTFNKGQNAIWLNVVAPASGQKDTDLIKQLKVQGTLDLINLPGRAGEMCKQQEMLNLTPFLNKERSMLTGQEELFRSLISTECKGCLLPLALTPTLVYAHPKNLQDAGLPTTVTKWTWDEFVTWAVRLTVPGMNRWGVALSTQTWMLPLAQYGGSLENGPVDYIKQGLTMVYNLQSVYGAHTPPNRQLGYGMASTKDFTDNKAAMAVLDPGLVKIISSGSATKAGWVVLPLPTPTLDMQVGVGNATDVIGIATDSNKTEAAWQVLKWLVSSAGAEALARAGLIPIYNLPAALPLLKPSYGENIGTALDRTFRPTLNRTGMNFTDMDNALSAYFTGTQDLDTTIQAIRTAAKVQ